jgi:HEAT repeat protein
MGYIANLRAALGATIPSFVNLLADGDSKTREAAASALAKLAVHGAQHLIFIGNLTD